MNVTPTVNRAAPRRVIVVDDFYERPDEVRALALNQRFAPDPERHKGERTASRFLFPGLREAMEQLTGRGIPDWEKHGYNGVFQFCTAGTQVVYHSDAQDWAAVVFLTPDPPPQAGTTLYRSRHTGGRTVEESVRLGARRPAYASHATPTHRPPACDARQAEAWMYGVNGANLLDPTAWEPVDVIGNVYNRLAIWDARLVHAASCYFGTRREDARLFHMLFWDSN